MSDNDLRIAVLKAQGWRFESVDNDHILNPLWREFNTTWHLTSPSGKWYQLGMDNSEIGKAMDEWDSRMKKTFPIPDPTTDKAAAMELLEGLRGIGWSVYTEGTDNWWIMLEEPGAEEDALFSCIAEDESFCIAACGVYLKAMEIIDARS